VGKLFISIFCCYFESLRRRENEFGEGKRKRGKKYSRINENNQTLVHWKEEGKALSLLQKKS
jgi:hypothetical protein